jgi:hypothetical protein
MGSLGKFVWPSANPGLRKLGVKEEDVPKQINENRKMVKIKIKK